MLFLIDWVVYMRGKKKKKIIMGWSEAVWVWWGVMEGEEDGVREAVCVELDGWQEEARKRVHAPPLPAKQRQCHLYHSRHLSDSRQQTRHR
jgi:hypothetical protein